MFSLLTVRVIRETSGVQQNPLCHRDYTIPGGAVNVAIFDNRLEIISSGLLPPGITVADLKRTHISRPRNPLIAEVFYRRGLIERWGRGTQKIVELCQAAGQSSAVQRGT